MLGSNKKLQLFMNSSLSIFNDLNENSLLFGREKNREHIYCFVRNLHVWILQPVLNLMS